MRPRVFWNPSHRRFFRVPGDSGQVPRGEVVGRFYRSVHVAVVRGIQEALERSGLWKWKSTHVIDFHTQRLAVTCDGCPLTYLVVDGVPLEVIHSQVKDGVTAAILGTLLKVLQRFLGLFHNGAVIPSQAIQSLGASLESQSKRLSHHEQYQ